mmetsp:Transcript_18487/g.37014  ORF Transcript_18487/g.37014 Transcript_18487/m.37014 type:complete len:204 (+) Transcript_18487:1001-1612(+)
MCAIHAPTAGRNTSICHQIFARPTEHIATSSTRVTPPHLLRNLLMAWTDFMDAFCRTIILCGFLDHFVTPALGISAFWSMASQVTLAFPLAGSREEGRSPSGVGSTPSRTALAVTSSPPPPPGRFGLGDAAAVGSTAPDRSCRLPRADGPRPNPASPASEKPGGVSRSWRGVRSWSDEPIVKCGTLGRFLPGSSAVPSPSPSP